MDFKTLIFFPPWNSFWATAWNIFFASLASLCVLTALPLSSSSSLGHEITLPQSSTASSKGLIYQRTILFLWRRSFSMKIKKWGRKWSKQMVGFSQDRSWKEDDSRWGTGCSHADHYKREKENHVLPSQHAECELGYTGAGRGHAEETEPTSNTCLSLTALSWSVAGGGIWVEERNLSKKRRAEAFQGKLNSTVSSLVVPQWGSASRHCPPQLCLPTEPHRCKGWTIALLELLMWFLVPILYYQ